MFRENHDHEQEKLFSPIKDLPPGVKQKLDDHWSSDFYEHVFTQISEDKFADLYHDGYSRPNKPVNELVGLLIIKHIRGYSDQQLEHAYIYDLTVRNALGKEMAENICANTFTNFRRRLLDYEEETGRNLLEEVFAEHRDYFIEEFDLNAETQRMDSTFIEANIKQLSRIDLIAKVVHNFLTDLPEEVREELPADIQEFGDRENLNLSYRLAQGEVEPQLETLVEYAVGLYDRFEADERINQRQTFDHLERVLDEQCYRISELEDGEQIDQNADRDDDDDEPPGWRPVHKHGSSETDAATDDADEDGPANDEESADAGGVGLKDPTEIDSDSLQNPHDDNATYRRKNDEDHHGYKANMAETCDLADEDAFRLITCMQVHTNNTPDTEFLAEVVEELDVETSLTDLLTDAGYVGEKIEDTCAEADVTQHFSGIKGRQPDHDAVSVADAEWDGHELVACPAGHAPFEQEYTPENQRYRGRFATSHCGNCPYQEECFVEERQKFFSYGFYERKLLTARRRERLADTEEREFLNLRAGAESLINEVCQESGRRTKLTGEIKVQNAALATAIGTNLQRASRARTEAAGSGDEASV